MKVNWDFFGLLRYGKFGDTRPARMQEEDKLRRCPEWGWDQLHSNASKASGAKVIGSRSSNGVQTVAIPGSVWLQEAVVANVVAWRAVKSMTPDANRKFKLLS